MMLFIDLRASASGGICAQDATVWEDGTSLVSTQEFAARVRGLDLVLATHGFNVGRAAGIRCLSCWAPCLRLPDTSLFAGVLWAGDSKYLPVISYPSEGDQAIASGRLLAAFLNREALAAASISFVSHSLGARTMLEAVRHLRRTARRLILMAGAIEDDCLEREYRDAAANAERICTLASRQDRVLQFAFPLGNPIGQILMHGHPYFETALGREGPEQAIAPRQRGGAWQIPDAWCYGHGDYLPDTPVNGAIEVPVAAPGPQSAVPCQPRFAQWESAWSASAVSTQVRS